MLELEVVGERVFLSPYRALFIPGHSTLVIADLHWGKSAAFRASGVPLPPGVTNSDLEQLSRALDESSAKRIVIIGDLLHAREGRHTRTLDAIAKWRAEHSRAEMVLVRGNHDSRAGDPPDELDISCIDGPLIVGPFACQHHPVPHETHYVLAGHLHPHVRLRGRGRQGIRLPCFAFRRGMAILPAFTSFTGGGAYNPVEGDRIFAIADGEIIQAGLG